MQADRSIWSLGALKNLISLCHVLVFVCAGSSIQVPNQRLSHSFCLSLPLLPLLPAVLITCWLPVRVRPVAPLSSLDSSSRTATGICFCLLFFGRQPRRCACMHIVHLFLSSRNTRLIFFFSAIT